MLANKWVMLSCCLVLLMSSCSEVTVSYPQPNTLPSLATFSKNHSLINRFSAKNAQSVKFHSIPKFVPQQGPIGLIQSDEKIQVVQGVQTKSLTITMDYSPLTTSLTNKTSFKTQSLNCSDITKFKLSITGINITTPLYPIGVDGNNHIDATTGCTIAATIPNVPFGTARIATVEAFSTGPVLIPGSTVKAVFDVSANPTNINVGFISTPAGKVAEQIISTNPFIASYMNPTNLQTLVNTITGVSGTFPNLSYTYHPSLVDTNQIATDLIANGGDSTALVAGNYDNEAYSTVTGTLAGLLGTDTASIQITDPASPISINNANGAFSFTNNVKNGTWVVHAEATGYTASSTPSVTIGAGGSQNVGTITFTWAATPNISSLSAASGAIGASININGTGFHPQIAGNTVTFNGVNATITAASPTQLTVTVPVGATTGNVIVQVGTQTSNSMAFTVSGPNSPPVITSVTPSKSTLSGLGFPVQIVAVATDSDDTLINGSYTWSCDGGCGTFNRTDSNTVIWTAPNTPGGPYTLRVAVNDGTNAPVQSTTVINVNNGSAQVNFTGANGEIIDWNPVTAGTQGFAIAALVSDPNNPNLVYAGAAGGGVYKSINAGTKWSTINTGLTDLDVTDLAIQPGASTTLFATTTGGGVYKSTDSGATWAAINTGLGNFDVNAIVIDPLTPANLYVVTQSGDRLYKSTNGGANWSIANTNLPIFPFASIAIDPTTPTTLYAGASTKGIHKSTDSGATWTALTTGITATAKVVDIEIDPITPANVYAVDGNDICRSTNSGTNFTCSAAGLPGGGTLVKDIALNPTTPSILYAATANQVYKSTDSGVNWSASGTGLFDTDVRVVTIPPSLPSTVYVGTASAVFKSLNSGGLWQPQGVAIGNSTIRSLAIDPTSASTLYAGTAVGLYRSSSSGSSWISASTGLTAGQPVVAVAVDPTLSSRLYAGTPTSGFFKSTNSGLNWTKITAGMAAAAKVFDIVIDPADASRVYAVDDTAVCTSVDFATNFTCSSTGLVGAINDLAIKPSGLALYAGTPSGVYISTDNGANWAVSNTGLTNTDVKSIAVDPLASNIIYVGTNGGGIYRSINSGTSWTAVGGVGLSNNTIHLVATDPLSSGILYAGNNNGFYRSFDSGATWSSITQSLPMPPSKAEGLAFDTSGGGKLYLGLDSSNGIYKSF